LYVCAATFVAPGGRSTVISALQTLRQYARGVVRDVRSRWGRDQAHRGRNVVRWRQQLGRALWTAPRLFRNLGGALRTVLGWRWLGLRLVVIHQFVHRQDDHEV